MIERTDNPVKEFSFENRTRNHEYCGRFDLPRISQTLDRSWFFSSQRYFYFILYFGRKTFQTRAIYISPVFHHSPVKYTEVFATKRAWAYRDLSITVVDQSCQAIPPNAFSTKAGLNHPFSSILADSLAASRVSEHTQPRLLSLQMQ